MKTPKKHFTPSFLSNLPNFELFYNSKPYQTVSLTPSNVRLPSNLSKSQPIFVVCQVLDESPQKTFACVFCVNYGCSTVFWFPMSSRRPPASKRKNFELLKLGKWSQARLPPHAPLQAPPQAPTTTNFKATFHNEEEKAKFECSYAKREIQDICTIKMVDFVEAKFKYWSRFKEFGWMPYLTTQYPVHKNLLWVFFSNATLESANEHDENLCHIITINTFVMDLPIWVM